MTLTKPLPPPLTRHATDFELIAASPVLRRGVPISGIAVAPVDLGAMAYASSPPPPVSARVPLSSVRGALAIGLVKVAMRGGAALLGAHAHASLGGCTLVVVSPQTPIVTVRALSGVE